MEHKLQLTTKSIHNALEKISRWEALAEYIWNGFDAAATCINIDISFSPLGGVQEIKIQDNGHGIQYENLNSKFENFLDSEKSESRHNQKLSSSIHGKNGRGRLTFSIFALEAKWETIYAKNLKNYQYSININRSNLNKYESSVPKESNNELGTIVSITNVFSIIKSEFYSEGIEFLKKEFSWFLELNKTYKIIINDENLTYPETIGEKFNFHGIDISGNPYKATYIRWNQKPNEEISRYYFTNSYGKEVFKETTSLNRKGDRFYHSVFIESSIFDSFSVTEDDSQDDQILFGYSRKSKEFHEIRDHVNLVLKERRRPFLKSSTDQIIEDLEKSGAFPNFKIENKWELIRKDELTDLIREIYVIEPKIFSDLNNSQKKVFVRFLDTILDNGERDRIFEILAEVLNLDNDTTDELNSIMKNSSLSNIVKTIKLIEDRYKAVEELKSLIYNKQWKVDEVPHIQNAIEKHYWLFGEQFQLVTAAEPKFEEALRRFLYQITQEDVGKIEISHPDKLKEMDIFAIRQNYLMDSVDCIVIELKSPIVNIGAKQLEQIKKYFRVLRNTPQFNANNTNWIFYLIGNKFDTSNAIEEEYENAKNHGEKYLVHSSGNFKIYVMLWSDVFNQFEIRHRFIEDKLRFQRSNFISQSQNPSESLAVLALNSAIQPPEIQIPSE
jgi:hypothetical protein